MNRENVLLGYFRQAEDARELRRRLEDAKRDNDTRFQELADLYGMLEKVLGVPLPMGNGPGKLRHEIECKIRKLVADREVLVRHWAVLEDQQGFMGGEIVSRILFSKDKADDIVADAIKGKSLLARMASKLGGMAEATLIAEQQLNRQDAK